MIGPEVSAKIEFCLLDMWKPYLGVIRDKCSRPSTSSTDFTLSPREQGAEDDIRAGEADA